MKADAKVIACTVLPWVVVPGANLTSDRKDWQISEDIYFES